MYTPIIIMEFFGISDLTKPLGFGGGGNTNTNTTTNTGIDGKDALNAMVQLNVANGALTSDIVHSNEAIQRDLINAGVVTQSKMIDAATEAARINADVAKNQADNTAAVMMNDSNNDRRVAIAQIEKDKQMRQIEGAERLGMAAINSDERLQLAQMNAQQQAHTVAELSNGYKYMAALNQEASMTGQENLMALSNAAADRSLAQNSEALARVTGISAKAIDKMAETGAENNKSLQEMAELALEANSVNNRINAEARDKQAQAALEAQIELTGVLLGPGGVQGLLGQQGNLLLNQQQQLNRSIYETQKYAQAELAQREIAQQAANSEIEQLQKELRTMELEKIKKESEGAMRALQALVATQTKNPELLKRPVSESLMSMISDTIIKTMQDCKAKSKSSMVIEFGGNGNTIENNQIIQENTFSATCVQDVTVVNELQTKIASTINDTMTIVSRAVADSMGLDPTQMDRKIREDVKNSFTSETVQNIANEVENSMNIKFTGTNNQIRNNITKQVNNSVFTTTQKALMNLKVIQQIDKITNNELKSDTVITSDESKNAAELGKTQAIAGAIVDTAYANNMNEILQSVMYFVIAIVLLSVMGISLYKIFVTKNKKTNNDNNAFIPPEPKFRESRGGNFMENAKNKLSNYMDEIKMRIGY
jgi:hypothetical protein